MKKLLFFFTSITLIIFLIGCNTSENLEENAQSSAISPVAEITTFPSDNFDTKDIPTNTPTPTPSPSPTNTPTPSPSPTNTPTPSPSPTNTPTPTPSPTPTPYIPESELLCEYQIEPNIWYRIYGPEDNCILIVSGTGSISSKQGELILLDWYDYTAYGYHECEKYIIHLYDSNFETFWNKYNYKIAEIYIEEGITSIGDYTLSYTINAKKITLPSTLKSIGAFAFYGSGTYTATDIEWIGLTTNIEINRSAFLYANVNKKEYETYSLGPTPTPTPNPENPKLLYSLPIGNNGDNVTYDFYDNFHLYIRGIGSSDDKDSAYEQQFWSLENQFELSKCENTLVYNYLSNTNFGSYTRSITHIIVEEGITHIGTNTLGRIGWSVEHIYLPKSYDYNIKTSISTHDGNIHGYWKDKSFTAYDTTPGNGYPLSIIIQCLNDETILEKYPDLVITWE